MPRRTALIVVGVFAVALLVVIVLLWSRGKSGSTAEFCKAVQTGENPLDVFDQYDPANVGAARAQLQHGVDRLRELQHAAPGEIEGDMKTLADVAQQLTDALDPANRSTNVPDFSSQFDKVSAASANVVRFTAANCGVQLDSGATTTSALPPPSS
jgi:hypothetical protein